MRKYLIIISLIFIIAFPNCTPRQNPVTPISFEPAKETEVKTINLVGAVASRDAEISSLAWYNDYLIILPQYPNRFGNKLFAIPKSRLLSYIKGDSEPIKPMEIQFITPNFAETIDGFEGFEAIAFSDNKVFLTIEAATNSMLAFLVTGEIEEDLSKISVNADKITQILPQADIPNASEETLFLTQDRVITIYEGNGKNINPNPVAHVFDYDLQYLASIPFPNIEYRITDATCLDKDNRFWAINYFWPGDKEAYNPAEDEITKTYGKGKTHTLYKAVERLVELQYDENGINLINHAPIQLQLIPSASRNWEGIVRLDNIGFIIATDKYPETILGFVKK